MDSSLEPTRTRILSDVESATFREREAARLQKLVCFNMHICQAVFLPVRGAQCASQVHTKPRTCESSFTADRIRPCYCFNICYGCINMRSGWVFMTICKEQYGSYKQGYVTIMSIAMI